MALLFLSPDDPADAWRAELEARIPGLEVRIWPEAGDPAEIEVALVWRPPPGELARYPNLRAILSLGAGIYEELLFRVLGKHARRFCVEDDLAHGHGANLLRPARPAPP